MDTEQYYQRIKALNLRHYAGEISYYSRAPLRRVEISILNSLPKNSSLLDLGCGSGRFSVGAAKLGFHVTGVDITPEAVKAAGERALSEAPNSDVKFMVDDMTKLPFPDNSFDNVICPRFSINAVATRTKRDQAIKEMYRVVKPGGQVFIESFNKWYLGYGVLMPIKHYLTDAYRILSLTFGGKKYSGLLPGDMTYAANKVIGAPIGYTHLSSPLEISSMRQNFGGKVTSISEIISGKRDWLKIFRYSNWIIIKKQ